MTSSIQDVVKYLNRICRTEVEKARAYFRWLTTRDLNSLPPEVASGIATTLLEMKKNDNYNEYSSLFVEMCK